LVTGVVCKKEMKNRFRRIIAILLLVMFLSPASSAVSGEIYKSKDKDGNVVFSDTPPPPGVNAEIKEFKEDTQEKPKTKEYPQRPQSESLKEKRPYGDIHVIMYMTAWCPYCVKARKYLHSLDINLIEYNIERDKSKREEMLSKSGGSTGVPLIDVEGTVIRGYNPDALKAAIERRRNL
jgi:glutaredoxin